VSDWTEKTIQISLCSSRGPVPYERYICIPNCCSVIALYTGESDLIAVSPAGYVKEFEIKISVSDLKKDKAKDKHLHWENPKNPVCEFWYVMPEEIFEACDVFVHIPEYAGVMTVKRDKGSLTCFHIYRKAQRKSNARKLTNEQMIAITRLGYVRYWSSEFKNFRATKGD